MLRCRVATLASVGENVDFFVKGRTKVLAHSMKNCPS